MLSSLIYPIEGNAYTVFMTSSELVAHTAQKVFESWGIRNFVYRGVGFYEIVAACNEYTTKDYYELINEITQRVNKQITGAV